MRFFPVMSYIKWQIYEILLEVVFVLEEKPTPALPKGGRTNRRAWSVKCRQLTFLHFTLYFTFQTSHFPLSFMSFLAACGPYVFVPRRQKNMFLCLYVFKTA